MHIPHAVFLASAATVITVLLLKWRTYEADTGHGEEDFQEEADLVFHDDRLERNRQNALFLFSWFVLTTTAVVCGMFFLM